MMPKLQEIEVTRLQPRLINPNQMSDKAFKGYKQEVERIGGPPKPIVVRPLNDDKFEIVDGEHAWRCCRDLGIDSVLCEIRDLDKFDASRECFNRNRGGSDNPLILGQMFIEMMAQRELSQRAFAKEMNISESKVRNILAYPEAFALRSEYAPDTAADEIAGLKQQQARFYLELPGDIRDRWLDAGADTDAFSGCGNWTPARAADELRRRKLTRYLRPTSVEEFSDSVKQLAELCHWCDEHRVEAITSYLPAVAENLLPAKALDLLPLAKQGQSCQALITPEAWQGALHKAVLHGGNRAGIMALIESATYVALREAGHDPADVCGPQVAEALQIVAAGPEFIGKAGHLSLQEQRYLAQVDVGLDDDAAITIKRRVVDRMHEQRCQPDQGRKNARASLQDVLQSCLTELAHSNQDHADVFHDPAALFATVVAKITGTESLQNISIEDVQAADILTERLRQMDWPEFYLLARGILDSANVEHAAEMWLAAYCDANGLEVGDE